MPYSRNPALLDRLITKALQQDEIQAHLLQLNLKAEEIAAQLKAEQDLIWQAGIQYIADFDALELRLTNDRQTIADATPPPSPILTRLTRNMTLL